MGEEAESQARRLIRKQREPTSNADVFEPASGPQEVYVDGFASQGVSGTVVKTDLYSAVGVKDESGVSVEERLVKLRLVMPTASFLEMCMKTLLGLKNNELEFKGFLDQQRDAILNALASVTSKEKPKAG